MVNENNKNQVFAAVAGAVVGAGAVIAGAIAMNDKANQKKVADIVKNVANKVIKSAEQATKSAKKEVKNL